MPKERKFRLNEPDDLDLSRERKKRIDITRRKEIEHGGFNCSHCNEWASINEHIGTHNRNHCPHCLWSKHLDEEKLGDRKSDCQSGMEPIALTFKGEGSDRYSEEGRRVGELMLVHECVADGTLRVNRIASDDNTDQLLYVFQHCLDLAAPLLGRLATECINVASLADMPEVQSQLFGAGWSNNM